MDEKSVETQAGPWLMCSNPKCCKKWEPETGTSMSYGIHALGIGAPIIATSIWFCSWQCVREWVCEMAKREERGEII